MNVRCTQYLWRIYNVSMLHLYGMREFDPVDFSMKPEDRMNSKWEYAGNLA